MPVSSTHPLYKKFMPQWVRCRDVVEGSDAVKGKDVTYLPRLDNQTWQDYQAFLRRALFFSVAGRSLQGLVGTMTRRTPTVNQEGMDAYFDDTSLNSKSFPELFIDTSTEVLTVGRYGLLADVGIDGGRAYIATYTSENILNWRYDEYGTLNMVVLREMVMVADPNDPFELVETTQYRVLELLGSVYTVTIYNQDEEPIRQIVPSRRGLAMNFIPFVAVTPFGVSIDPEKPPILDIVDVNLSQYMTSADLENGRHFVALPTPVITGAESEAKLKVGGTTAWVISNDKAKAYYLEFQGQGLQSLEKAMVEKTSQMAQFSSRLMDTSTRGSEAAETVRLRHSADSATLSSVAVAAESAFNIVFGWVADFDRLEQPTIELNKEFLDTKLTPAELKALTDSYVSGAIDLETYIYNLERGELLPFGKDSMDSKPVIPDEEDEEDDDGSSDDQDDEDENLEE